MAPADTDEALFSDFLAGERQALGRIAQRYERSMLGLARGLLGGSSAAAQEAVQEAWLRVIRSARSFDGRSSLKTWLYAILINRCRDLRKRDNRLRARAGVGETDERASHEPTDSLEGAERSQWLRAAVEALPDERRVVLLLCYHAQTTHPQAAAILGIPLGTLKSRLHAALRELRAQLPTEQYHGTSS